MRAHRVLAAVISTGLLFGATACGGDDDGGRSALSSEEQAFADALASQLQDVEDGYGVSDDEGACMATSAIDVLGLAPFEEAGVSPEDIADSESPGELLGDDAVSDADATTIAEAWGDCADLPKAFASAGAVEFDLDGDGVACLEDGLRGNDILTEVITATFTSAGGEPDGEILQELIGLVTTCSADEDGEGGLLVELLADSLEEGGLSEDEARCIGQYAVDTVGNARLVEITADGGSLGNASPEVQQELEAVFLDAAEECGVPAERFGN